MDSYRTVGREGSDEFVEKKSRFIGAIRPVTTPEEAQAFIAEKKSRYWDASHNCSAYILRQGGVQRYSDDGEPQGTAGVPILEVLKKEELQDVCVVVTRYFGGTLLGAGGLVRAYSHGAKIAVDAGARAVMTRCTLFRLEVPYPLYDRVNLLLQQMGVQGLDSGFGTGVTVRGRIEAARFQELALRLTELSGATLSPVAEGEAYHPVVQP